MYVFKYNLLDLSPISFKTVKQNNTFLNPYNKPTEFVSTYTSIYEQSSKRSSEN